MTEHPVSKPTTDHLSGFTEEQRHELAAEVDWYRYLSSRTVRRDNEARKLREAVERVGEAFENVARRQVEAARAQELLAVAGILEHIRSGGPVPTSWEFRDVLSRHGIDLEALVALAREDTSFDGYGRSYTVGEPGPEVIPMPDDAIVIPTEDDTDG